MQNNIADLSVRRSLWREAVGFAFGRVWLWQHRLRSRRHLGVLDDRLLQDIGIDRLAAVQEQEKPFWRR